MQLQNENNLSVKNQTIGMITTFLPKKIAFLPQTLSLETLFQEDESQQK